MIYGVVESDDKSVIKIGYTKTAGDAVEPCAIAKRLDALQSASWRRLVCIAMAPGAISDERELHRKFAAYHVRGEWFLNHAEVSLWTRVWRCQYVSVSAGRRTRIACVWPYICECSRCVERRILTVV